MGQGILSALAIAAVSLVALFWSDAQLSYAGPQQAPLSERSRTQVEQDSAIFERIGECALTSVASVEIRPATFSTIEYANGLFQVEWVEHPGFENTRPGDQVRVCLKEKPDSCPSGDTRGRIFTGTNTRTGESWHAINSFHSCGGA